MRIGQQTKLRIERFLAVSLLLIAAIVSGTNLLRLARAAEEREVSAAANNYSEVRKIYADQLHPAASVSTRLIATKATVAERIASR